MKRGVALGLCGCLLLAPGCQSGAERAGRYRQVVDVGMTRDQVEERLGDPDGWEENVSGYEVWAYSYKPSFGHFLVWRTVDLVELTLALGLIFGLVLVTRGAFAGLFRDSGPSVSMSEAGREGRFQRFVFRIGFNPETGRVAYVSSPLPE